ncbi:hypothetical protein AAFF_G00146610 [Aldrovandia affinis]|uniref:Uncharacterized protein n=1 Tax=Aldrovandia affinis TaxID=143900 RepID=A0AAD7RPJ1_9TELE|nr:hypothetical protein AAFF_G00146610 [Aldrovandia affinis]
MRGGRLADEAHFHSAVDRFSIVTYTKLAVDIRQEGHQTVLVNAKPRAVLSTVNAAEPALSEFTGSCVLSARLWRSRTTRGRVPSGEEDPRG